MRPLLVLAVAFPLALAACGDGGELSPTPTPSQVLTSTAAPTPSPTPELTPTPDLTAPIPPISFDAPRLVFSRGQTDFYLEGELWLADVDGSNPVQLTPFGVRAGFAGVVSALKSGRALLYYLTEGADGDYTVWSLDLSRGQRSRIHEFEAWGPGFGSAAVNPAGTHVAYTDKDGLWLLDLNSGAVRMVLEGGDRNQCGTPGGGIAACKAYRHLAWAPGGTLLAVSIAYWEGGEHFIVDPFAHQPSPLPAGQFGGGKWSPDANSLCTWGQYAGTSALYVAQAPDWATTRYFEEFEGTNPTGTVTDCGWLDDSRLVATASGIDESSPTAAWLLDLTTGSRTRIADFPDEQPFSRVIVQMPGDASAVVTQAVKSSSPDLVYVSPAILSADGSTRPVLKPGDWVVAVIAP